MTHLFHCCVTSELHCSFFVFPPPSVSVTDTAPEGGALWGDSVSSLLCSRCTISNNIAAFVGGGVSVRGSMVLSLQDTLLYDNRALRATAVWGYGERAVLRFSNTESRDGTGSIALILGHVDQTSTNLLGNTTGKALASSGTSSSGQMKWSCQHAGSVMDSQEDDRFYSKTCSVCQFGTYNIFNGSSERNNDDCRPCECVYVCVCV